MKLKIKLTLLFSLLTAVTLLLSSIVGYEFTKVQVTTGIEEQMKASVNSHVNKLDGWLISKAKMLDITAGTIRSTVGDGEINVPLVAGYRTVDKELSDVYFGSTDGKMVDGSGWAPPADYDPRVRSWYKAAIERDKLTFTEPYLDMVTKQMAVSVAIPLKNSSGQLRGVLAEDILLQTLVDQVQSINLDGKGYAFLIDAKGTILAHPDQELLQKNVFEIEKLKEILPLFKDIIGKEQGFQNYRYDGQELLMFYQKVPSTSWTLAISVPTAVVYKPLVNLKWIFALITIGSVLLVILVTFFTVKRITKPVEALAGHVNLVAGGNLTIEALTEGKDEIAELASGFNAMVKNLRGLILRVHNSVEQMAASSEELTASSSESAQASSQVANSVTEIAQGADTQQNVVEKTSAVVEEIASSIRQATTEANYAVEKSSQAGEKAKEGGISIARAVEQMILIQKTVNHSAQVVGNLGERSKEIGQIVDTISGIAAQTNLLALNAAIEAARAGEQGRGFAVVAEEVRKLAEQSQESAKQIAELIGEIQNDTDKAVIAMDDGTQQVSLGAEVVNVAGDSFQEITILVTQVSEQVAKIFSAISQIDMGNQRIVSSVGIIDDLSKKAAAESQTVSAATEEQSASMAEIASASQNLANMAQQLRETVGKFQL